MILVTIGSAEPFERLLLAVAELPGDEELVVQCGVSAARPSRATCVEFMPFAELLELMRKARVIVSHAGVGTLMAALECDKQPLVVPRLRRFGEAVDDHQLAFARRLGGAGLVRVVEEMDQLAGAVADPPQSPRGYRLGGALANELGAFVRAAIRPAAGPPLTDVR